MTKHLHPMNAYERRLVHITIRKYRDLGSRSEGDGALKKVRIYKQGSRGKQGGTPRRSARGRGRRRRRPSSSD